MKSRSGTETGSESGSADFSLDELLLLLVYVYSLAQETQASGRQDEEKVEQELIGALTLLLTQQTTLSPLVQGITGTAVFKLFKQEMGVVMMMMMMKINDVTVHLFFLSPQKSLFNRI